jgi:hypothetical protein
LLNGDSETQRAPALLILVARLVGGQQHMRSLKDRGAAGPRQLHVVARLGQRVVLNGFKAVGLAVGAGVDAEHAGHRQHRGLVDTYDARMRVRRAHHRRVSLTRIVEVVAELALAGNQPRVFGARHRLADETKCRFGKRHGRSGSLQTVAGGKAPNGAMLIWILCRRRASI